MSSSPISPTRPKVTAFRFSETHQLLYDPLGSDFMSVVLVVRSVYKQSREKHRYLSLYVQNIPGYREKKEGAFKNTKMKCHFKFHFVAVRKIL